MSFKEYLQESRYYYDVYTIKSRKLVKLESLNHDEYPDEINRHAADGKYSPNALAILIVRRSDGKAVVYDAVGDKWKLAKHMNQWSPDDGIDFDKIGEQNEL